MAAETVRAVGEHGADGDQPTVASAVRRGSLIAGVGLLVMTPLAAFANFGVLGGLVMPGDATRTASAILNAEGLFRVGIASLFVVAVLDLIVAWALYSVFEPVNGRLALLAGWLRAVFAGVFLVAISRLVGALSTLTAADSTAAFGAEQRYALALSGIDAFYDVWDAALILVGLHLVVLGYLLYASGSVPAYQSGLVPTVLGVLLAVAGAGYVIDSFGRVLVAGYAFEVAAVTFVGEVLLIVWLFVYGRRVGSAEDAAAAAD